MWRRLSCFCAGSHLSLTFTLDAWAMSVTHPTSVRVINPGSYRVWAGSNQPNVSSTPPSATFTVTTPSGDAVTVSNCPSLPRPCYGC